MNTTKTTYKHITAEEVIMAKQHIKEIIKYFDARVIALDAQVSILKQMKGHSHA